MTPKRRFRPVAPKATAMCSPLPKTPPKPASNAAAASMPMMVRQDTPWPSAGNMSGNMFQDRNWLLPKDYLATEEKEEMAEPYQKEEHKMEEQYPKEEKCFWGLDALYVRHRRKKPILHFNRNQWKTNSNRNPYPTTTSNKD